MTKKFRYRIIFNKTKALLIENINTPGPELCNYNCFRYVMHLQYENTIVYQNYYQGAKMSIIYYKCDYSVILDSIVNSGIRHGRATTTIYIVY